VSIRVAIYGAICVHPFYPRRHISAVNRDYFQFLQYGDGVGASKMPGIFDALAEDVKRLERGWIFLGGGNFPLA
jgi:hypothetical protein